MPNFIPYDYHQETMVVVNISEQSAAIATLFEQVVLICHEQKLIGHDLIAIDGCKLPCDAAKEWSGTFEELEHKRRKLQRQIEQRVAEHKAMDKVSADSKDKSRHERLQKTINTLSYTHEKVTRFLDSASPHMGKGERVKEVKSNITDNESCKMKTCKGTIQGCNGIASVDAKHQIIIDAQAIGEGQEQPVFLPVLERIRSRYERLGISDNVYDSGLTVTADTGYWKKSNLRYLYDIVWTRQDS